MAPAKTSKDMESNNRIEVKDFAYCSDKYQYTMGKSFYETGRKDVIAVFNMFYRKAPENNNWAVVSGIFVQRSILAQNIFLISSA